MSSALAWIDEELAALDRQSLRRRRVVHAGPQGATIEIAGQTLANFGSNDYLALTGDARVVAAAREAAEQEGWGAGASPLLTGYSQSHELLERRLAEFEQTEAAVVFVSGFAANLGTIGALVGPGDVVFSDQWNHASMIDGCRLSRAEVCVYPHADVRALAGQLRDAGKYRRKLIVTDSLFSMEGDFAPLAELADLAERYEAMLMVDEAHGTGVFGAGGRGVAEHLGVMERVDVRMGTLSKALGASGGFVAGSRRLVDWLVNRARPYIFSTASPPATCAAAASALEIVRQEPWRRETVLALARELRERIRGEGWDVGRSESQIVPLVVGEPERALQLSAYLREQGIWAPAIRPPSVPAGRALLRISLTAGHRKEMIDQLCEALGHYRSRMTG
jgi:8-amino-7-oxononanoate synthase